MPVDAISLEVFKNLFASVAEECKAPPSAQRICADDALSSARRSIDPSLITPLAKSNTRKMQTLDLHPGKLSSALMLPLAPFQQKVMRKRPSAALHPARSMLGFDGKLVWESL